MMKNTDYKKLANNLLDFVCENYDLVEVCSWLIEWGYSYDQLLELGFEQDTIDQAKKELNKEDL
jgi:hypothetical protein